MARLQSRQISQLHLYQVLHAVRQARGPVSRAEIGEVTGLSQPAVSSLTRRLLSSLSLVEVGARPSQGSGRRERELAINAEHLWVVGAKVSMSQITITLTDFAGGVRHTAKRAITTPLAQATLVRLLAHEIEACIAATPGLVRQRLSGVGVAVAGLVDSMAGEVVWTPIVPTPNRARNGHRLAQGLTEALGVPAFVENDANLLALAELWFGEAGHVPNVAVVTLEHGLGLGLVVNGELYRGHRGLAAELGHIEVVSGSGAAPCRCGKRGCLEAYVAKYALVAQAQRGGLLASGAMSGEATEAAYAELVQRALAGERKAMKLFAQQGRLLGQWIGNLVNLMSPELVILDTGAAAAAPLYEPVLRDAMAHAMAVPGRGEVPLSISHHGEEVWARGAAALVLQRLDESTGIVASVARHGSRLPATPAPHPSSPAAGSPRFSASSSTHKETT